MKIENITKPLSLLTTVIAALSAIIGFIEEDMETIKHVILNPNTFILISIFSFFLSFALIFPSLVEWWRSRQPETKWRMIETNLSHHFAIRSSGTRDVEQIKKYHELDDELRRLLCNFLKVRGPDDVYIMQELRQEIRPAVVNRDKNTVIEIAKRYNNSLIDREI